MSPAMSGPPSPPLKTTGTSVDFPAPDAPDGIPISWFVPGAPRIEVDFGCHRGTFLLGMAEKYPDIHFLGIEKQASRVEKCLGKIRRRGLANALA